MSGLDHVRIDQFYFEHGHGCYGNVKVRAGIPKVQRITPPAGPDHAFDVKTYPVNVEISVSPAGRSVHVWVNGKKVA